jgi:hypothetical protein
LDDEGLRVEGETATEIPWRQMVGWRFRAFWRFGLLLAVPLLVLAWLT